MDNFNTIKSDFHAKVSQQAAANNEPVHKDKQDTYYSDKTEQNKETINLAAHSSVADKTKSDQASEIAALKARITEMERLMKDSKTPLPCNSKNVTEIYIHIHVTKVMNADKSNKSSKSLINFNLKRQPKSLQVKKSSTRKRHVQNENRDLHRVRKIRLNNLKKMVPKLWKIISPSGQEHIKPGSKLNGQSETAENQFKTIQMTRIQNKGAVFLWITPRLTKEAENIGQSTFKRLNLTESCQKHE